MKPPKKTPPLESESESESTINSDVDQDLIIKTSWVKRRTDYEIRRKTDNAAKKSEDRSRIKKP